MKKTTNAKKTNAKTPTQIAREKLGSRYRITSVRRKGEGYVARYYDQIAVLAYDFSPELNTKPKLRELFFTM